MYILKYKIYMYIQPYILTVTSGTSAGICRLAFAREPEGKNPRYLIPPRKTTSVLNPAGHLKW